MIRNRYVGFFTVILLDKSNKIKNTALPCIKCRFSLYTYFDTRNRFGFGGTVFEMTEPLFNNGHLHHTDHLHFPYNHKPYN